MQKFNPTNRSSIHLPRQINERLGQVHAPPVNSKKDQGAPGYLHRDGGVQYLVPVFPSGLPTPVFRFSANTLVYQDVLTTLTKIPANAIQSWGDQSGSANHLLLFGSGVMVFSPFAKNNLPGINFLPGAAFALETNPLNLSQPYTIFMVQRFNATSSSETSNILWGGPEGF